MLVLKGDDGHMEETLSLLGHFLDRMKPDEDKLESIKDAGGNILNYCCFL